MRPASNRIRTFLIFGTVASIAVVSLLKTYKASSANSSLFAPMISASKTVDQATTSPGGTLMYNVTIVNGGTTAATSVLFSDTIDSNTTLVPGSVNTSPLAINDSYSSLGNVGITVPVANGLLANDFDPDGTLPMIMSAPATTAQGGNVSVMPSGAFSYNPPPGFEGIDSFNYTITDGLKIDTGTVSINVSGMIWFIDNNQITSGDGRLSSPFNSVANFNSGAADDPGDNIFLYESATSYSSGITLLNNQKLIGQDASVGLAAVADLTPPTFSNSLPATNSANGTIVTLTNAGGNAVTTESNNRIQGLVIGTSSVGVTANGFGTLTIRDLAINGSAQAVNFNNGTLDSIIGTVTVSNRTTTGLQMNSVAGAAQFGATSIPNPLSAGGYGIRVENSSAAVTFASATISNTNQTVATSDAGSDGIPDSDGDGDAIFLKNTTGSFTLNGGTLSNLETDGIDCRSCRNLTVSGVTINQIGVNSSNVATVDDAGIFVINISGTNLVQNSTISRFEGQAVNGAERGINILQTNGNNFTEFRVNNTDFFNTLAAGAARGDDGISYRSEGAVSGKLIVENGCTFQNISGLGIEADAGATSGSSGTFEMDILDSSFSGQFSTGSLVQGGVEVQSQGNMSIDVEIRRSTFTGLSPANANAGVIHFAPQQNNGSFTAVVDTCTILGTVVSPGTGRTGRGAINLRTGDLSGEQLKNLSLTINNCDINDIGDDSILLDIRGESLTGVGSTAGNVRITNNRIGTTTPVGQDGLEGIQIRVRNNLTSALKTVNLLMDNNQVRNADNSVGDETVDLDAEVGAIINATVTGNTFTSNGSAQDEFRASTEDGSSSICLDLRNNTATQGAGPAGNGSLTAENVAGTFTLRQSGNNPAATTIGTVGVNSGCTLPSLMAPVEAGETNLQSSNEVRQTTGGGSANLFARARQWLRPVFGAFTAPTNLRLPDLFTAHAAEAPAGKQISHRATNTAKPVTTGVVLSGETVMKNIALIPPGKTVSIMFSVTVNSPFPAGICTVANQGTVSGSGFSTVVTDDPNVGGIADPTVTTVLVPPVIGACPTNITTNTDSGLCTAVVTFATPGGTGCPTPSVTCSPASGSAFPKGTTTVTCTATNTAGSDSCSFTVTVNDNQGPALAGCPTNIVANTDPGLCTAAVSFIPPTATDACDGARPVTCVPASGSTFPKGTTTVTCSASDALGNASSCSFSVTVNDNQGPVLTGCPTNITTNTDAGLCTEAVTFATPLANDICDGSRTVTCSPASGSAFAKGTTTVTCSSSDSIGNASSCSFTVTVNDNQPPVLSCPSPISVTESSPGSGSATVTFSATASDVCDGSRTVTCSPASGSSFSLGTTTVNCSASDTSSNTGTCSFTVTVTQSCTISCPSNINVNNSPGQCGANVSFAAPATTAGCGTVTCSHNSGDFFPVGTTTVSCNTSTGPSCSFTVTVNDNEGPSLTCPTAIKTTTDSTTGCTATVSIAAPTAVDNCGGSTTVTGARSDGQPLNDPYPLGTTTITWTAKDSLNNASTCTQTVTVTNPDPVVSINAPASGAIFAKGAPVSFSGSFTDNPGAHTANWTFDSINVPGVVTEATGAVSATYTFNTPGVYLVTLTVDDNCGGSGTADTVGGLQAMVVIYDPTGGFVTGGGWINSPPGAYVPDPTLTGKANFGFVSKYKKGSSVPEGDTEFQFKAANLNFKSTVYEWLVVAGPKAQFKGSGKINNAGDYRFILTAIDGQINGGGGLDKFRIRIWNNSGGGLVYDNQLNAPDSADPTTVLGGGNIVIHKSNGNDAIQATKAVSDFDGDGRSDLVVWRGRQGDWLILESSSDSLQTENWGAGYAPYNDVEVAGDYDGDGITDVAVFRRSNGHWYIKRSSNGQIVDKSWGLGSDIPVPADYDGDGKTDIAVWRGSEGKWYIVKSSNGSTQIEAWGAGNAPYLDVPVPADFDGDGKADLAVFRRSEGTWFIKFSSTGSYTSRNWGIGSDVAKPADYDGDGKADIAVWRGSNGNWLIVQSGDNSTRTINWGTSRLGDIPVPGDYDGDGLADIAVWRPADGTWYVRLSSDNSVMIRAHGSSGDTPVTNK
ncbi:MAG: HYR domain-containing protein [Blastocatellales bacterium]